MLPEQVGSNEGALQAEGLFRIPNTGIVDRHTDPINDVRIGLASDLPALHHRVKSLKTAKKAQNVVGQEHEQSLEEENHKDLLGWIGTPSSWQTKASLSVNASILEESGCTGGWPQSGL